MKFVKFSSIILLATLMICAFTPEVSAKNHHRHHCRTKRYSSTFFGFNLNLNPTPTYVAAPVVERVTYVQPQPVAYYYPYYEEVVVQRPAATYYSSPKVYVQPQFSYWNY